MINLFRVVKYVLVPKKKFKIMVITVLYEKKKQMYIAGLHHVYLPIFIQMHAFDVVNKRTSTEMTM